MPLGTHMRVHWQQLKPFGHDDDSLVDYHNSHDDSDSPLDNANKPHDKYYNVNDNYNVDGNANNCQQPYVDHTYNW